MNKRHWELFYSRFRWLMRHSKGIKSFPHDFNSALLFAVPGPGYLYGYWANGQLARLRDLAFSLYECPQEPAPAWTIYRLPRWEVRDLNSPEH